MANKKARLFGFVLLAVVFACCAVFTACQKETHEISTEWSYNSVYHYHDCSCDSVNHRTDVGLHDEGACFCGYGKSASDDNTRDDTGSETFSQFTLEENGTLKFNKIKGASKYVLTVTPAGSDSKVTVTVGAENTTIDLNSAMSGGFPSGKTTIEFQAWGFDEVTIDGEKIKEEVQMTGLKETFRVIKSNGKFTLQPLTFEDDFVKLDGFYIESVNDDEKHYVYESLLSNNNETRFNVSKYIEAKDGVTTKIYKSAEGRESNDSDSVYGKFDLSAAKIRHGENRYYLRAITDSGEISDYDLVVYGLYNVNVMRYLVTVTDTNEYGLKTCTQKKIGETIKVTERDIIVKDVLFADVAEGIIARNDLYEVIEKGDYDLGDVSATEMSLYFYDEETVFADCDEFNSYKYGFDISDGGTGISLYATGDGKDEKITIPYVIAGKAVTYASIWNDTIVKEINISEGFTEYNVSLNGCSGVTDIYLPSTINYIGAFAFSLPENATIHCAFSSAKANSFHDNWNRVNGQFAYYTTVYNSTGAGSGGSSASGGINYKLVDDGLVVAGTTDRFRGTIPDTAMYNGTTYNVVGISRIGNCSDTVLKIGKNLTFIEKDAFEDQVKGIELSTENTSFVYEGGALYNADKTRLIATSILEKFIYIPETLTSIDSYSLGKSRAKDGMGARQYSNRIIIPMSYDEWKEMLAKCFGSEYNVDSVYYEGNVNDENEYGSERVERYYFNGRYHMENGAEYIIYGGSYQCAIILSMTDREVVDLATLSQGIPIKYDWSGFVLPPSAKTVKILSCLDERNFENVEWSIYKQLLNADNVEKLIVVESEAAFKYRNPDLKYFTLYDGCLHLFERMNGLTYIDGEDKFEDQYTFVNGIVYITSGVDGQMQTNVHTVPKAMKNVVIAEGVTSVQFVSRYQFTDIELPATCKEATFIGMDSLVSIKCNGEEINLTISECWSLSELTIPRNILVDDDNGGDYWRYGLGPLNNLGLLRTVAFNGTVAECDELYKKGFFKGSYVVTVRCTDGEYTVDKT